VIGRALLVAAVALGACNGKGSDEPVIPVPERAATAGDPLLALAPVGADALLEVDLARLRDNPVVGPLARALLPGGDPDAAPGLLAAADAVVIASYGLGDAPRSLILARGADLGRIEGAVALGDEAIALGDAELSAQAGKLAVGKGDAVAGDRPLMALRAGAMPPAASSASVRFTARLGFEARVTLARRLDLDAVPVTISGWADVVDDLAIVARLGSSGRKDTSGLEREASRMVARLAEGAPLYGPLLSRELAGTVVTRERAAVKLTLVIGPRRLAALVGRALEAVGAAPPPAAVDEEEEP
jgi:hypothetical protein